MTHRPKTRRPAVERSSWGTLSARLGAWFDGSGIDGSGVAGSRAGAQVEGAQVEGAQGALPERARGAGELAHETKGAIFVEYVALLLLVTVGGAAAVVSLGAPLVALARFTQLVIGLPIP